MKLQKRKSSFKHLLNNEEIENPDEQVSEEPEAKKLKVFSIKQFRKQLNSPEKLTALKEFSSLLSSTASSRQNYILEYLKNGGTCLELLQILENDSSVPPTIVFTAVTSLLLGISAKFPQYYSSAYESCRYLINNYLPVIHKMIGLSSSKDERKACIKLLTAMVTFSSSLAKDIIMNVKFHTANIELLSKHTREKNSVRDCFIHFLTAFLVDSDLHTLSVLLEKNGLLTSIISGLQYDDPDTVVIVITAMKNHILENPSVMKTTKMHVFNTAVVKDMVNLYNWKGPDGLKALEKNNKTVFEVDKLSKSKVNECVHDFLLVLCTSHKHGVIFRDPMVGLGRKNLNGLMYTVLDSLDRPWEHSYAKELVIKICRSCPDLTKNMWSIVKPYLEPRHTEKWLKVLEFSKNLVQEMDPVCIEYCAKDLNLNQLSQVIEILITPSPILKTLLTNDNNEVKVHILKLLSQMLKKMHEFISALKKWTTNFEKIKLNLANFVNKHYPNGHALLEEWKNIYLKSDHADKELKDKQAHLEIILEILSSYKDISSQLLYNVSSTGLDFKEFVLKLTETPAEEQDVFESLLIKTVSLFVDTDYALFLPKSDTFGIVISLLLKHYCAQKSQQIGEVLFKIFKISGLFNGALYEIPYWINGIFNVGHFSANLAQDLVNMITQTSENLLDYQKTLQTISGESNKQAEAALEQEDLIQDLLSFSGNKSDHFSKLKCKNCSVMVIGALKYQPQGKSFKKYLEFVLVNLYHSQTNPGKLRALINENLDNGPQNIVKYVKPWQDNLPPTFEKAKNLMGILKEVGDLFFIDGFRTEVLKEALYPHFLQDVLNMLTFYVSQLVDLGSLQQNHLKNYISVMKFILENQKVVLTDFTLDIILGNQNILKNFNVLKPDCSLLTKLILIIVKELEIVGINVNSYLHHYANKVFANICKMLRKLSKFSEELDFNEYLEVFPLTYDQTQKILSEAANLLDCGSHSQLVQTLVTYGLERTLVLSQNSPDLKPIDNDLVKMISGFLAIETSNSSLAKAFKQYLEYFSCSIQAINKNLFSAILNMPEYNKNFADLSLLLLERNWLLSKKIQASICDNKGLVLPIVELLLKTDASNDILQKLYDGLESSLLKALQKPQKVGQHFQKGYRIGPLIGKCMPKGKCSELASKVHKFEVTEVFHVELLQACFNKVLLEPMSEKSLANIIMTFIHLEIGLLKKRVDSEDEKAKVEKVSAVFSEILDKISLDHSLTFTINESYKTFCKFALKYGISGQHVLLKTLNKLISVSKTSLLKDDAGVLMDMLLSHSEFLNLALGEHSDTKFEVLSLMLVISENWGELVEKSHVAVVLSAYRGLVTRCDRVILDLLKIYESKPDRTSFYDFKPFLWGRAAATHYSVRTQIASSLTRQPKISDVLGLLKEHLIHSTILNQPLTEDFQLNNSQEMQCYDLKFFLPLFSHILAPEQQVKTYVFIRSGALSLTVLGLACQSKEIRQAACHVLARLYFHLEARQTGKDNLLWIRFIEALCKGVAVLPDFKLNNFSGIFFARMAMILTNPKHVMYSPLSSYLTAKQNLDLSTCPELYTLLFSPDVNHKEHRNFILEVLRDGMKHDKDLLDLLKSMGYKMFSELLNGCLCDGEGRTLIFEVMQNMCSLPLGVKILTENYSFLAQLELLTSRALGESDIQFLDHILSIYLNVLKVSTDKYSNMTIFDIIETIFDSDIFGQLKAKHIECLFKIFYTIYQNDSSIVLDKQIFVNKLTAKVSDRFCNYLRQYGCGFVSENNEELKVNDSYRYLRLLVFNMLK